MSVFGKCLKESFSKWSLGGGVGAFFSFASLKAPLVGMAFWIYLSLLLAVAAGIYSEKLKHFREPTAKICASIASALCGVAAICTAFSIPALAKYLPAETSAASADPCVMAVSYGFKCSPDGLAEAVRADNKKAMKLILSQDVSLVGKTDPDYFPELISTHFYYPGSKHLFEMMSDTQKKAIYAYPCYTGGIDHRTNFWACLQEGLRLGSPLLCDRLKAGDSDKSYKEALRKIDGPRLEEANEEWRYYSSPESICADRVRAQQSAGSAVLLNVWGTQDACRREGLDCASDNWADRKICESLYKEIHDRYQTRDAYLNARSYLYEYERLVKKTCKIGRS